MKINWAFFQTATWWQIALVAVCATLFVAMIVQAFWMLYKFATHKVDREWWKHIDGGAAAGGAGMSECVVRMEMPQNCINCDFRYECNAFYASRKHKPFMKGCRIICQLPEGHGRLVDKDKMLKKIENYHRYMTVGRESDPRCIIEDSPTIVPAEEEESKET